MWQDVTLTALTESAEHQLTSTDLLIKLFQKE